MAEHTHEADECAQGFQECGCPRHVALRAAKAEADARDEDQF